MTNPRRIDPALSAEIEAARAQVTADKHRLKLARHAVRRSAEALAKLELRLLGTAQID